MFDDIHNHIVKSVFFSMLLEATASKKLINFRSESYFLDIDRSAEVAVSLSKKKPLPSSIKTNIEETHTYVHNQEGTAGSCFERVRIQ